MKETETIAFGAEMASAVMLLLLATVWLLTPASLIAVLSPLAVNAMLSLAVDGAKTPSHAWMPINHLACWFTAAKMKSADLMVVHSLVVCSWVSVLLLLESVPTCSIAGRWASVVLILNSVKR